MRLSEEFRNKLEQMKEGDTIKFSNDCTLIKVQGDCRKCALAGINCFSVCDYPYEEGVLNFHYAFRRVDDVMGE